MVATAAVAHIAAGVAQRRPALIQAAETLLGACAQACTYFKTPFLTG